MAITRVENIWFNNKKGNQRGINNNVKYTNRNQHFRHRPKFLFFMFPSIDVCLTVLFQPTALGEFPVQKNAACNKAKNWKDVIQN